MKQKNRITTLEALEKELQRTNSIYIVDKYLPTTWVERWRIKTKERYLKLGIYSNK